MELASFVSLIPILFAFSLLFWRARQPSAQLYPNVPPGPKTLPVIGNLNYLFGELPHRRFHQLAQEHGPLMRLQLGHVKFIVASSPEVAEDILKANDINFSRRPEMVVGKIMMYGSTDITFSPVGGYWRQLRKICSLELLSVKRVKSFSLLRQEEVSKLINEIYTAATRSSSATINLSEKVAALANDVTARASFGVRCEHSKKFIAAMKVMVELASGLSIADLFPDVKFINVVTGIKFRAGRAHRDIDSVLGEILEEHRRKRSKDVKEAEEDLVDVLLRVKDSGELEVPLTDNNIKAVINDIFTGGTETSSTVIEWAMAELIRHPECMEKIQDELRRALAGKETIEEKDLEELHYMKMVIMETMRLHSPLPLLVPRQCTKTCEVQGYRVDAGTRVIVNAWAIGRDPQYWKDPEKFEPERFDGSHLDFKGVSFEYLPFGAGRRICPGINFGLANVNLTLAYLLFFFDWKLPNGMKAKDLDMTEKFGITVCRKAELCLIATPYALACVKKMKNGEFLNI